MFGTDGIRGVANFDAVSPEAALTLGRVLIEVMATAEATTRPCVVLGRDTRLSGPMLEAAMTAGMCSAGAEVIHVGVLPTPGVAYMTLALGALAGVMISASHNPFADNGIKLFTGQGEKLPDDLERAIEARCLGYHAAAERPSGDAIGTPRLHAEAVQQYGAFLQSTLHVSRPMGLRIGLDCANGSASVIAPALFTQLGAEVRVWHAAPDGRNINRQCGSLHPEFLRQRVVDERLDVGFAFDGDADRLVAVDHTGAILDGDYLLAICASVPAQVLTPPPRVIVGTVMANMGLERYLQQQQITLHRTQVGDKYVMQAMRQHGATLGGEQSGHIIFLDHHTTGDGLLTAMQILNAMLTQQTCLAELAQVLQKFPQVIRNVPLHTRQDPLRLPRIRDAIEEAEKGLANDGRILVRLSGTEAAARVMVEGVDATLVQSLADRVARVIARELGAE